MSGFSESKEDEYQMPEVQNRGRKNEEEEEEPIFNDRNRGPNHKITRKTHSADLGILSYLPSSAKYIFIAMMGMGIISIIYIMIFSTGSSSYKFQNKGKLSTFIKSRFMSVYYKTENIIDEYNVYDLKPYEFFSILIPNGVPVSLAMNKGQSPSDKYLSSAKDVLTSVETKIANTAVEASVVLCNQNFNENSFQYEVKSITISNLKEYEQCYYVDGIMLNEKELGSFKNYLYDRMPYLSYLPLQNNKIKVSVGNHVSEEAKWNKEHLFLCNLEVKESTNYPAVIIVSPIYSKSVPIIPEGAVDKSFVNLYTATKENNTPHYMQASTCLYIPLLLV